MRAMWAYYEARVLDLRPAVATPPTVTWSAGRYGDEEVTTIRYFDARVNSFHRSIALDPRRLILPYVTTLDARSWYATQAIIIWRSLCLFGAVVQVRRPRTKAPADASSGQQYRRCRASRRRRSQHQRAQGLSRPDR